MHNEKQIEELPTDTSLFVVSDYLKRWYQARLPIADIAIITNGVDTEAFQPSWTLAESSATLKLRHGIPANKKVILYVGRMSPEKGPLDLARAFQELSRKRGDVLLLLVGEFSSGNASTNSRVEYGNQIRNICRKLGENCIIVGSVDPATIHEYYHLGDLVVVPSEFEEPFCMVAIEAMAAGVPVLVAKKGGLPEFIREGQTGFFINDSKDSNLFAQQIGNLLDGLPTLDPVRANARNYVEQNNRWQEVTHQLELAYSTLLKTSGA
jgi:UDP-glucose:(glucosyl)LPS alpha-1,2-glucosyltransferase/UDP-N-acetylglucosamine:(glucosyl)LPS alpha-1,2-N-acetylglucosaminyltransferase